MLNIPTIHLVLLIAATWRIVNLIVHEEGPFYMFTRLRKNVAKSRKRWVRKFGLVTLVNCEYCSSIWIGLFFSVFYLIAPTVALVVSLPLALSTGTIFVKHIVFLFKGADTRLENLNNPPYFSSVYTRQDANHERIEK